MSKTNLRPLFSSHLVTILTVIGLLIPIVGRAESKTIAIVTDAYSYWGSGESKLINSSEIIIPGAFEIKGINYIESYDYNPDFSQNTYTAKMGTTFSVCPIGTVIEKVYFVNQYSVGGISHNLPPVEKVNIGGKITSDGITFSQSATTWEGESDVPVNFIMAGNLECKYIEVTYREDTRTAASMEFNFGPYYSWEGDMFMASSISSDEGSEVTYSLIDKSYSESIPLETDVYGNLQIEGLKDGSFPYILSAHIKGDDMRRGAEARDTIYNNGKSVPQLICHDIAFVYHPVRSMKYYVYTEFPITLDFVTEENIAPSGVMYRLVDYMESSHKKASGTWTEYKSGTPITVDSNNKILEFYSASHPEAVGLAGFDRPTSIEFPAMSDLPDKEEYYTLSGMKVENPGHGIFIRCLNGKASKIRL